MFYDKEFKEDKSESFVSINRFIQPRKDMYVTDKEKKVSLSESKQKNTIHNDSKPIKDVKTENFALTYNELNEYVHIILQKSKTFSKQNEMLSLLNADIVFDILEIPSFGVTDLIGLVKNLEEKSILSTVMNIYPLILSALEKTDLPMSKFKQEIRFKIIYRSYKEGHHITGGNKLNALEYLRTGGSPGQAPIDVTLTWIPKNDMLLRIIHKEDVVGEMKMFEGMSGSDLPGLEYLREQKHGE